MIEVLAADEAVAEIEVAFGGNATDRQHLLVDRPGVINFGVDAGGRAAREIGVLAKAARHRFVRQVAA